MPINPDFMSIAESGDFEKSIPTDNGEFFFVEDGKFKVAPMDVIYEKVSSAYLGIATPSTTPPETGSYWYRVTTAGTYTNFLAGGMPIEVSAADLEANLVHLEVTDGVAKKVIYDLSFASDNVADNSAVPVNSKAIINYAQPINRLFLNKPQSIELALFSAAVENIVIDNYEDTYTYALNEVRKNVDLTADGLGANTYMIYLLKIDGSGNIINADKWMANDIDESDKLVEFYMGASNVKLIINWNIIPDGFSLFGGTGNQFILNPEIRNNTIGLFENKAKHIVRFGNANTTGATGWYVAIGHNALSDENLTSGYHIAIGDNALRKHRTGGGNIAIGPNAMMNSEESVDCTLIGFDAGRNMVGGVGATGVGRMVLRDSQIGAGNTAIGDSPLMMLQQNPETFDGYFNTAVGYTCFERVVKVRYSVGVGHATARHMEAIRESVILGKDALFNNYGVCQNNVVAGYQAMYNSNNTSDIISLGTLSLNQFEGTETVALGSYAGASVKYGKRNIFIGHAVASSGSISQNIENCILIGEGLMPTKSNEVRIGTVNTEEVEIAGVRFTKVQLQALKNLVS